jgi:hypothetical protein
MKGMVRKKRMTFKEGNRSNKPNKTGRLNKNKNRKVGWSGMNCDKRTVWGSNGLRAKKKRKK